MSVIIETSIGNITIDLYTEKCKNASRNFLKLCKIKYYNGHLFYNVHQNFIAQTGDPTGTGRGGSSINGLLYGDQAKYFDDEIYDELNHKGIGTVGMASSGSNLNTSQFYFTLRSNLDYLDGKHTIFGNITEGLEIIDKFNELIIDKEGRPMVDIRILHTHILSDPFPDPNELNVPPSSPLYLIPPEEIVEPRLTKEEAEEVKEKKQTEDMEKEYKKKVAKKAAVVLEMIDDIPDADIKPPDNVLFICKLNPVTEDNDLELIFSRFGEIKSCEIIRDHISGDSLQYGFIEFETKRQAEEAYFKMDNALIDDRRIHVDFSQSVSKLWNKYRLTPKSFTKIDASINIPKKRKHRSS